MISELFTPKDVIDIVLVATIMYGIFRLLRRSGAANLFWGILAFVVAWLTARYLFHLELTGALFDRIISVGAIALIIIFQNEIRAFFYGVGFKMGRLSKVFRPNVVELTEEILNQIVTACLNMSKSKTGALIVITRQQSLDEYADTGEIMAAHVSARLIENIFFKNTPLHDGALIIHKGRMLSAACILPLSASQQLPKEYGLRHRAAMGVSEKSDAIAIVVSEETGHITLAFGGEMHEVKQKDLAENLRMILGIQSTK